MKTDRKFFHIRSKKKAEELKNELESSGGVGKKDTFAMLISAFLVFVPISAAVIGVLALVMLLLFRAL